MMTFKMYNLEYIISNGTPESLRIVEELKYSYYDLKLHVAIRIITDT